MRTGEIAFVERIRKLAAAPEAKGVVLGIGDDCAIYRPRSAGEDLLFTTDMLIEGAHFRRGEHPPFALGWKALARGLSDIAAMGGEPRFCLLSLTVPSWADDRWTDRFLKGLLKLARQTGTVLAGGDTARSETFNCDIVVCGAVPKGTALRRDAARAGDVIYVSGRLGGSALGLATHRGKAWKRHMLPEPRLGLGQFLREQVRVSAAMDLSDGLSLDLRRLCLASGVAAEIEPPPLYPGASLEQALHGGEDYELLFTIDAGRRVPRRFGTLPLTQIGVIVEGRPGSIRLSGRPLKPRGFDHLA